LESEGLQQGRVLAVLVRAEVEGAGDGELRVGRDRGDLDPRALARDLGDANVAAEAVGLLDLEDLQRSSAFADRVVRRDGGDELPEGAVRGLVVGARSGDEWG